MFSSRLQLSSSSRGDFTDTVQKYYMEKSLSGKGAWQVLFKILLSAGEPYNLFLSTCCDDSPFLELESVTEGWPYLLRQGTTKTSIHQGLIIDKYKMG